MSTLSATLEAADSESLIYPNEKRLFVIGLVISVIAWLALVLGTLGIALIYVVLAFIFYLFIQSALVSYLQGNGTRITAEQFPDLHQRIQDCAAKLGVDPVPDAYLLLGNGVFNAFATRFLGRNFVVLMSDVVDALESEPDAVNFYIGHELGHIRRRHLVWGPLLFPASILPLLGAGYSRAREYTCDRHGLVCCTSPTLAAKGLAALAAGGRRWKTLDTARYAEQAQASGGFWMSFHELTGSYPWLVKRMARVLGNDQVARIPSRNVFAWVLAAFIPRLAVAGGAASLLITVAVIGILAAVALPAYQDYTVRAKIAGVLTEGDLAAAALEQYYYRTGSVPANLTVAGYSSTPGPTIRAITNDQKAVIRIELAFSPLQGKAMLLVPSLDSNKRIIWKCTAGDVPPRYVPLRCR